MVRKHVNLLKISAKVTKIYLNQCCCWKSAKTTKWYILVKLIGVNKGRPVTLKYIRILQLLELYAAKTLMVWGSS